MMDVFRNTYIQLLCYYSFLAAATFYINVSIYSSKLSLPELKRKYYQKYEWTKPNASLHADHTWP